jgi:hypothetical protein
MRARVNRLVYVVIGAALAVGLLVSAFVGPEAQLTASEDCYGLCPSVTALSLSSSTVTYGNEQVEKFTVRVTAGAPGTGVPTGDHLGRHSHTRARSTPYRLRPWPSACPPASSTPETTRSSATPPPLPACSSDRHARTREASSTWESVRNTSMIRPEILDELLDERNATRPHRRLFPPLTMDAPPGQQARACRSQAGPLSRSRSRSRSRR